MRQNFKVLFTIFLLVMAKGVFGQTFPVQLIPQSIPPQPIYISDYTSTNTTTDRLRLQILLNDLTVNNQEVKLKVYLEGEGILAQSRDLVIGASPLFIDGGVPLQLGSLDLAPYFEFQNLQGINPNIYADALPEGIYQFCYEVFDAFTGNALSQKTCSTIVLFQNEPPFLTLPHDNSTIEQQDVYNILFQWTPRHVNVTNAQYEFSLVQIFDNYVDPQAAFLASQPIFQTVVSQTSLLYDMRFPPLLGGYRYAWRVRAFATNGAEEIGLFTNQGHSEIWSFVYTSPCNEATAISEESILKESAKIVWTGDIQHLDYNISYREKNAGSDWYVLNTPREYIKLNTLRAATTYEYKVAGNCNLGGNTYSPILEFTTVNDDVPDNTYVCNIPPGDIDLSNQELQQEIFVNDLFFANDFPITVLELSSSTPPFSGKGYIGIPWLNIARVGVEFQGIQINTGFKLVQGVVQTTYDADWNGIVDVDEVLDDVFGDDGDIGEFDAGTIDIATVEVNDNGDVVIIDENGNPHPIETDLPVTITDANGDQWTVGEDGTVTEGGEAEGGTPDSNNTNGISGNSVEEITSEDVTVTFLPSGFYATDIYPEGTTIASNYESIPMSNGNMYKVLYKAVSDINGHIEDELLGTAVFNNGKTKDDIVFKTMQGTNVPVIWESNGTSFKIPLKKQFDFAKAEILATVKHEDSTQNYDIAGKTNVWHMAQQDEPLNVTIVRLNGASTPNDIQTQLNNIYHPVGASFNISEDDYTIDASVWDIDVAGTSGKLDIFDSGLFDKYSDEENALLNYYKQLNTIDEKRYYVFVLPDGSTSKPNILGFMPRGKQFGFVFNQNGFTKTLAHELAHGVFGLKHYNGSDLSNLLMNANYTGGTKFTHMDWQNIHAPGIQFYLFDGDDDGAGIHSYDGLVENYENILGLIRCSYENNDLVLSSELISRLETIPTKSGLEDGFKVGEGTVLVASTIKNNGEYVGVSINLNIGYKENLSQLSTSSSVNYSEVGQNVYEFNLGDVKIFIDSFNLSRLVGTDDPQLFKEYITASGVYSSLNEIKELVSNIISDNNLADDERRILSGLNRCQLEKIHIDDRNSILKIFSNDFILDEFDENNIFDVLTTTADADSDKIFEAFRQEPEIYEFIRDRIESNDKRPFFDALYNVWKKSSFYKLYHPEGGGTYNDQNRDDEFYREVQIEIENMLLDTDDCMDTIMDENNSSTDICNCLDKVRPARIQGLSYEDRIHLIEKVFEGGTETLFSDGSGEKSERAVVRLIKYVPTDFENDNFITYLNTEELSYNWEFSFFSWSYTGSPIKLLIKHIDNHRFLSGDYRKELLQGLISITNKSNLAAAYLEEIGEDIENYDLAELEKKIVTYDYDYKNILVRTFHSAQAAWVPYTISANSYPSLTTELTYNQSNSTTSLNIKQTIKSGLFPEIVKSDIDYNPFSPILFSNISKLPSLQGFNDENGNKVIFAPAILAHYASEEGSVETTKDIIVSTVDVATLVIPGAQLGTLAKVFYYADKISSLASLAGTYNAQDNPELAGLFNQISLATGVVSLGSIVESGVKSAVKNSKSTVSTKSLDDIANDLDSHITKLDDILENHPEEITRFVHSSGENGVNHLIEILETEKNALGASYSAARITRFENVINKLGDRTGDAGIGLKDDAVTFGNTAETATALSYISKTKNYDTASDDFVDLIVHGVDDKFIINGAGQTASHRTLANYIQSNYPGTKPIRLLSCSSIDSAQDLANKLNRDVVAHPSSVKVHSDGGISVDSAGDWLRLTPGGSPATASTVAKPKAPATGNVGAFVRMGVKLSNKIEPQILDEIVDMLGASRTDEFMKLLDRLPGTMNVIKQDGFITIVNKHGDEWVDILPDRFSCSGGIGDVAGWNPFLNLGPPLMKNFKYEVDDTFVFHTDELGRVKKVTNDDLKLETRTRNDHQQQRAKDIKDGYSTDDGGHMMRAQWKGPSEQINYFPQAVSQNRPPGAWYKMEDFVSNLKANNPSANIQFEVTPIFNGNGKRPIRFEIEVKMNGQIVDDLPNGNQKIFPNPQN